MPCKSPADSAAAQSPQAFRGRDEVVGAGQGYRETGEGIALAGDEPRHAVQHSESRR